MYVNIFGSGRTETTRPTRRYSAGSTAFEGSIRADRDTTDGEDLTDMMCDSIIIVLQIVHRKLPKISSRIYLMPNLFRKRAHDLGRKKVKDCSVIFFDKKDER
jgi:hypothetical protein